MAPEYPYPLLKDPKRQFRLFKLSPGNRGQDLKCKCEVFTIGSKTAAPRYRAISYVYGNTKDPANQTTMDTDKGSVTITASLEEALQRLRELNRRQLELQPLQNTEAPEYLWADSICIHPDEREKTEQIPVMKRIYGGAEVVLIWLGNSNEEGANTLIRFLLDQAKHGDTAFQAAVEKCSLPQWMSLYRLLRLDWFGRVWTLQEVCLAKKAALIFGRHQIDWKEFHGLCCRLRTIKRCRYDQSLRLYQVVRTDINFWDGREGPGLLLDLVRSRKCAEVEDRVRGILGLGAFERFEQRYRRAFDKDLYPDSLKDKPEPKKLLHFDDTVARQLLRSTPFYVLSLVKQENTMKLAEKHRPLWLPHFSQRNLICSTLADEGNEKKSWTAGGRGKELSLVPEEDDDLILGGCMIDSIKWRSGIIDNKHGGNDEGGLVKKIWQQMANSRTSRQSSSVEDVEALCKVLYMEDHFSKTPLYPPGSYPGIKEQMKNCLAYFKKNSIPFNDGTDWKELSGGDARGFLHEVLYHCRYRRFFVTEKGHLGLGPAVAETGDKVCVFVGGQVPYLLRPQDRKYLLCGECFVHKWMDGKAIKDKLKQQEFRLM